MRFVQIKTDDQLDMPSAASGNASHGHSQPDSWITAKAFQPGNTGAQSP
jgi:hypothetical protein